MFRRALISFLLFFAAVACQLPDEPIARPGPPLEAEQPFSCDDVKPAWSYTLPADILLQGRLSFGGVTDVRGNLYWLECTNLECTVVSFTPEGVERLRRPVPEAWIWSPLMASHGRLYLADLEGRPLVLSDETGEVLWRGNGPAPMNHAAAVDRAGNLWALEAAIDEPNRPSLVVYRGETGEVLSTTQLDAQAGGLTLDAYDNAHVFLSGQRGGAAFADHVSIAADGRVRFLKTQPQFLGPPVAELDGRLLLGDGTMIAANDASVLTSAGSPTRGGAWLSPLMSVAARFRWASDPDETTAPIITTLEGYEGDATSPSFRSALGRFPNFTVSHPVLLSNGNAVLWANDVLRSFAPDGREVFACPMALDATSVSATALTGERWISLGQNGNTLTVKAFTVPGLRTAAHGWTGRGGNPGQTGHAR